MQFSQGGAGNEDPDTTLADPSQLAPEVEEDMRAAAGLLRVPPATLVRQAGGCGTGVCSRHVVAVVYRVHVLSQMGVLFVFWSWLEFQSVFHLPPGASPDHDMCPCEDAVWTVYHVLSGERGHVLSLHCPCVVCTFTALPLCVHPSMHALQLLSLPYPATSIAALSLCIVYLPCTAVVYCVCMLLLH